MQEANQPEATENTARTTTATELHGGMEGVGEGSLGGDFGSQIAVAIFVANFRICVASSRASSVRILG